MLQTRPQRGNKGQRQYQAREGDKDIGDAHQHAVDFAAKITGGDAQQQAQRPDGDRYQQHDVERDACAPHQATEDIPAKLVGAEPVGRAGRRQRIVQILNQRVIRRDPGREQRHDAEHQHYATTNRGQGITGHAPEEIAAAGSKTLTAHQPLTGMTHRRSVKRDRHTLVLGSNT